MMRKKRKHVVSIVLSFALMLSGWTIPGAYSKASEPVSKQTRADAKEYSLYPVPQSVSYKEGSLTLSNEVNVVYESKIDEATKNRLKSILDSKGITISSNTTTVTGKTNILVGTKDSKGAADNYASTKLKYDKDLFSKVDPYLLSVGSDTITILGKDTDSAFYAISTLKLILQQSEGKTIRQLQIEDFAIGQYRGFIEGYYGMPWSVDDRISLMNFGGDFKMNIYIFAPKDDPYHNAKWKTLYPAEELENIKKMVAAGAASKCRFAWAIHPFMNDKITNETYDADLKTIKDKFQQLYDAGVRQFVISADDASSNADLQKRLLDDMNTWVKAKKDMYPLVFVPMLYCTATLSWGYGYKKLDDYYNILKTVDSSIEMMWTGEWVCHPATQATFDKFKQYSGREPFMWLNWPVNDVNHKRLVMGPAENCILNTGGVKGFKGIVTNPLEQAEASKTSLFAIADYAWNTSKFNAMTSWKNSFQYIDKGAPEALNEICQHLTNPRPGGITGMDESWDIKPLITAFQTEYRNGSDVSASGKALSGAFEKIVKACDDFQTKGTNTNLKDEMKPWVDSLRSISKAGIGYTKTAMALQKNDDNDAWANYAVAVKEYFISKNCEAEQLKGSLFAESGAEVLIPYAASMDSLLKQKMEELLKHTFGKSTVDTKPTSANAVLIKSELGGLHQGEIANITDKDDSTFAWFNQVAGANSYIGLDLGEQYKIDGVKILQGTSSTMGDIFSNAILEYSVDGEKYEVIKTISNKNDIEEDFSGQSIVGRYIRIRTAAATGKWYAIREFSASTSPASKPVYTNAEALSSQKAVIQRNQANIITSNDSITLNKGEYIGIQLPKILEVTEIAVKYTENDKLKLETSEDGKAWKPVQLPYKTSNFSHIRLRNDGAAPVTFTLNEFSLKNSDKNIYFLSSLEAADGYLPEFSSDNSLLTSFVPKERAKAGSLVWRLEKAKQLGSVYILTYPDAESDAVVSVQKVDGTWHECGKLSKNLNIISDLENFDSILNVKIEWKNTAPNIVEMYTTEPRVPGITLNKTSAILDKGKTLGLKADIIVEKEEKKDITWSSSAENIASVSNTGVVTGKEYGRATITASAEGGKYTAICDIIVNGRSTPAQLTIKDISAGSEQPVENHPNEGPASLANDGNQNSIWHSNWDGDSMDKLWICADLGSVKDVASLQYQPRQDSSSNGNILGYELYVSQDNQTWHKVDEGTWNNDKTWKETSIPYFVPARYIKLQATEIDSNQENNSFASAAEIKIMGYEKDDVFADRSEALAISFEEPLSEDQYTEDSYKTYIEAKNAVATMAESAAVSPERLQKAMDDYARAVKDLVLKSTIVTENKYTISFDSTGGSAVTSTLTLKDGDPFGTLPTTVKNGFTFLGWYLGDTKVNADTVFSQKSNLTLKAKWQSADNAPTLPEKVTGMGVKAISTSAITIQWAKAKFADSYIVERYDAASKKWTVIATTTALEAKDSTCKPGKHYTYRITGSNKAGKGIVSYFLDTASKPSRISLKKASQKKNTKKVTMTWKKADADGYEIYMRTNKGKFQKIKTIKKSAAKTYTVKKKFKKNTSYSFKIRAYMQVAQKKVYGAYSKVKKLKIR